MKRVIPAYLSHKPASRRTLLGNLVRDPERAVTCPKEAEIACTDTGVEFRGPVKYNPGWWKIRLSQHDAEELALIGYIEIVGNTYSLYSA